MNFSIKISFEKYNFFLVMAEFSALLLQSSASHDPSGKKVTEKTSVMLQKSHLKCISNKS